MANDSKKKMKFQLLSGSYTEGFGHRGRFKRNPDGTEGAQIEGPRVVHKARGGFYPVVESATDLCKRFNRPLATKFKRVPDDTPLTNPNEGNEPPIEEVLQAMNNKELAKWAAEHGIDIGSATRKDEILAVLMEATLAGARG